MMEETIFAKAIEIEDADKRRQFLDDACQGDRDLRCRLEALLSAKNEPDSLLDQPIHFEGDLTQEQVFESNETERQIGPYRILQQIGEGGFGIVYMAERKQPMRQRVALKIIKPGMDSKAVVARFEAERQALAMMDHPNIARILDGGVTDSGRPYFVMDLVKGVPITEFCNANKLSTEQRLELFITVCHAVNHAHQKGIIHRDLKPSNILVTLNDGKPMPKVIDFGVAKALHHELTEKTYFTQFGQMIGTLQYMSPEQAEMSAIDIDTRSDIYSLGVVLYELLTGGTPIPGERLRATAHAEIQRIIREEEPPKPSLRLSTLGASLTIVAKHRSTDAISLCKNIAGELDWIVMKTLDKDRSRRYGTANELSTDVANFLQQLPVNARPPSRGYLFKKFAARHKATLVTATCVFAFVMLASVGAFIAAVVANHYRDIAEQNAIAAEQLAEQQAAERYESDTFAAVAAFEENSTRIADQLLLRNIPADGSNERDYRGIEWYLTWNLGRPMREAETIHFDDYVTAASVSPSGRYVAIAFRGSPARVVDLVTRQFDEIPNSYQAWTNRIAFCNSDFVVLHVSEDRQAAVLTNWKTGASTSLSHSSLVKIGDVCVSRDGSIVVASGNKATVLWRIDDQYIPIGEPEILPIDQAYAIGLSPNNRFLVVCDASNDMTIHDRSQGKIHDKISDIHDQKIWSLDVSTNGKIATVSMDRAIKIWDIETGTKEMTLQAHDDQVRNVQFCPTDDRYLASSGRSDEAFVWDLQTRAPIKKFRAYSNGHAGCFSPDGGTFFVAGSRTLAMWELAEVPVDAIGGVVSCRTVKLFDDNRKVAALNGVKTYRQSLSVFGTRHGIALEHPFDGQLFRCMDMAPSGIGYLCTSEGILVRWDANTGDVEELNIVQDRESSSVTAIAIDPENQDRIALGYSDGNASLFSWSESTLQWLHGIAPKTAIRRLKFAGDLVIAADSQSNQAIGDTELNRWKATFHHLHDDWAWAIAVSKDGNTVATGSWDHTIKVWDIHTGEVKQTIVGVFDTVHGIALVDDDQTIVAATGDGSLRFFDIDSARLKARFEGHRDTAFGLAVSADEKLIVSSGRRHGRLRLWRVADKRTVDSWLTTPAK